MSISSFKQGVEDGRADQDPNLPTDQRTTSFLQDRVIDLLVPGLGLLMSAAEVAAPTVTEDDDKDYIEGYKLGVVSRR